MREVLFIATELNKLQDLRCFDAIRKGTDGDTMGIAKEHTTSTAATIKKRLALTIVESRLLGGVMIYTFSASDKERRVQLETIRANLRPFILRNPARHQNRPATEVKSVHIILKIFRGHKENVAAHTRYACETAGATHHCQRRNDRREGKVTQKLLYIYRK